MTLFLILMVPCTVAILCAARAVDGMPGFILGTLMLGLQAMSIVSYTTYVNSSSVSDAIMYECETVHLNDGHTDDYIAILQSYDYYSVVGDGEILYSPGCRDY